MKRQRIFLIVTAVVLVGAVSGLVFALSQRDKAGNENTIESENKNTIENENKSESKSESEGENKSECAGENKNEGAGENKSEAEIKIEYELPEVPEGSVAFAESLPFAATESVTMPTARHPVSAASAYSPTRPT